MVDSCPSVLQFLYFYLRRLPPWLSLFCKVPSARVIAVYVVVVFFLYILDPRIYKVVRRSNAINKDTVPLLPNSPLKLRPLLEQKQ